MGAPTPLSSPLSQVSISGFPPSGGSVSPPSLPRRASDVYGAAVPHTPQPGPKSGVVDHNPVVFTPPTSSTPPPGGGFSLSRSSPSTGGTPSLTATLTSAASGNLSGVGGSGELNVDERDLKNAASETIKNRKSWKQRAAGIAMVVGIVLGVAAIGCALAMMGPGAPIVALLIAACVLFAAGEVIGLAGATLGIDQSAENIQKAAMLKDLEKLEYIRSAKRYVPQNLKGQVTYTPEQVGAIKEYRTQLLADPKFHRLWKLEQDLNKTDGLKKLAQTAKAAQAAAAAAPEDQTKAEAAKTAQTKFSREAQRICEELEISITSLDPDVICSNIAREITNQRDLVAGNHKGTGQQAPTASPTASSAPPAPTTARPGGGAPRPPPHGSPPPVAGGPSPLPGGSGLGSVAHSPVASSASSPVNVNPAAAYSQQRKNWADILELEKQVKEAGVGGQSFSTYTGPLKGTFADLAHRMDTQRPNFDGVTLSDAIDLIKRWYRAKYRPIANAKILELELRYSRFLSTPFGQMPLQVRGEIIAFAESMDAGPNFRDHPITDMEMVGVFNQLRQLYNKHLVSEGRENLKLPLLREPAPLGVEAPMGLGASRTASAADLATPANDEGAAAEIEALKKEFEGMPSGTKLSEYRQKNPEIIRRVEKLGQYLLYTPSWTVGHAAGSFIDTQLDQVITLLQTWLTNESNIQKRAKLAGEAGLPVSRPGGTGPANIASSTRPPLQPGDSRPPAATAVARASGPKPPTSADFDGLIESLKAGKERVSNGRLDYDPNIYNKVIIFLEALKRGGPISESNRALIQRLITEPPPGKSPEAAYQQMMQIFDSEGESPKGQNYGKAMADHDFDEVFNFLKKFAVSLPPASASSSSPVRPLGAPASPTVASGSVPASIISTFQEADRLIADLSAPNMQIFMTFDHLPQKEQSRIRDFFRFIYEPEQPGMVQKKMQEFRNKPLRGQFGVVVALTDLLTSKRERERKGQPLGPAPQRTPSVAPTSSPSSPRTVPAPATTAATSSATAATPPPPLSTPAVAPASAAQSASPQRIKALKDLVQAIKNSASQNPEGVELHRNFEAWATSLSTKNSLDAADKQKIRDLTNGDRNIVARNIVKHFGSEAQKRLGDLTIDDYNNSNIMAEHLAGEVSRELRMAFPLEL